MSDTHNPPDHLPVPAAQTTVATPQPAPQPAARQRLASEDIIVHAPMSFAGSTLRLWRITRAAGDQTAYKVVLVPIAITLIVLAWGVVICWYILFGLLLLPYRLLRRGSRKRKRQGLQHREMLDAIERAREQQ